MKKQSEYPVKALVFFLLHYPGPAAMAAMAVVLWGKK